MPGRRASARPIATRWRWPPESWRGLRCQKLLDAQHPRHLGDAALDLGARQAAVLEPEGQVLAHRHVRIEGIGLEHHGEPAIGGSHVVDPLAVEHDVAAGGPLKAGDDAQQGRLAAAGRADEDDELAMRHLEVDLVDDAGGAERLDHPAQLELAHFIPVVAMPVVMKRCRKAKMTTTGSIATTVMAST